MNKQIFIILYSPRYSLSELGTVDIELKIMNKLIDK